MKRLLCSSLGALLILQSYSSSLLGGEHNKISVKKFIDLPINGTFSRVDANIVKENHSNLYWQDNKEAKTTIKTFDEAKIYCKNLTLGDIDGWRLPTYKELLNIVNYKREKPSIFDEFQNCAQDDYWSSTKLARNSKKTWYIYFREARSNSQYITKFFAYKKHIRCINDNFTNKRFVDTNFTREGDTIVDNIHHLQWQDETKTKVETYNFSDAKAYCKNLILNGYSDWRVPTVKEYISILDTTNIDPATYDDFFYTAYNKQYWASHKKINSGYGWYVDFENGMVEYLNFHFKYYVRCVRGQIAIKKL